MQVRSTVYRQALARLAAVTLALSGVAMVSSAPSSYAAPVATPAVSAPPDVVVGEADGFVDLPVTLNAPGQNPATVNYTTQNSTALSGTTCGSGAGYVGVQGSLTFAPGQTTQTVRVDLLNCQRAGAAGFTSFTFGLSTPGGATIARASTRIDIVGNPAPATTPTLTARDATVDNSAGTINLPVVLGGPTGATSASTVSVDYTTTNGTATAGTDYTATSGTLTFTPGQTVQPIPIAITNRTGNLPPRRFAITLSNPTNATLTDTTGTIVIGASGAPPLATPAVSAPPDVVVGEADGFVDLPVTLNAPGQNPATVNYTTQNSTALSGTTCGSGAGYVGVQGSLTFAPGQTTQTVRVDLLNCQRAGAAGFTSFTFGLSTPGGATIARASTRIDIVGNPAPATTPTLTARDATVDNSAGTINLPVVLGGPTGATSASTVSVDYTTTNGTATAGTDYTATSGTLTFTPGQTVQPIPIAITNRTGNLPPRRFAITLSNPTNATLTDTTGTIVIGASGAPPLATPAVSAPPDVVVGEADGFVDLPVTLNAPGQNPATVNYTTQNSTALSGTTCGSGAGYVGVQGSLTFAPGQTTQTVRVDLLNCQRAGAAGFTSFTFGLSTPGGATIARASTRIDIVGNPAPATTPTLTARDATVDNSAGTINLPVVLGGPTGATSASTVSVDYTTTNGTATAGTDYTATSGTLTFTPGQTVQPIPIAITNRTGNLPPRRFAITLSNPTNATLTDTTGTIVIGASGAPPLATPAVSAPPDVVVGEADGFVDLPVTLNAPGQNPATVNYTTQNSTALSGTTCGSGAGYVGVQGSLTFAPGQTTQTVRVDLLNCQRAGAAGFTSFTFGLSTPGGATIARASTRIDIVGNPAPATTPTLTARDATVDNSAGTINLPVVLGGPTGATSASTVSVDYTTTNGTATAGTDYTATSGTLTFTPGQTVQPIPIAITNRTGNLPPRRFAITLSNPTNATLTDTTGTIVIGASGAPPLATPAVSAPPDVVVGEADGFVDLPVTLNAPGQNPATVNYTTQNSTALSGTTCGSGAGYVGVQGSLTFAPGQTTQTVRVDLLNCQRANPGSFLFGLSTPGGATIARSSATITIVQTAGVPGPPTGVTAVPADHSAVVSFSPPASNGGDAINAYTVTASPGGATASGPGSPQTVNGLTDGVSYTFTVRATNSVGTGPPSSPSNAVVPTTVPAAPAGLTAKSGDGSVSLSWKAPPSVGGVPVNGYDVYVGTTSGNESSTPVNTTLIAATTYTVSSLADGTTYYFVVKAHNAIGNSSASTEVSATPWAATFVSKPGAATDISVGANGSVWVIGTNSAPGGFGIYRWTGTTWASVAGAATEIAIDPHGNPWIINASHHIYRWTGTTWASVAGAATNISIGANGAVWVIGTKSAPGGFGIYRWTGTTWTAVAGAAVTIAVDPHGNPWIINASHHIYRWTGTTWASVAGAATNISIGANGAVWVIGTNSAQGGFGIFKWTGTTWVPAAGAAVTIAVDPHGNPWIINASQHIYLG